MPFENLGRFSSSDPGIPDEWNSAQRVKTEISTIATLETDRGSSNTKTDYSNRVDFEDGVYFGDMVGC
jgi:hypothetical protein